MKPFRYIVLCLTLAVLAGCKGGGTVEPTDEVRNQMLKSPKRGVAFNFTNLEDLPLLSPSISWGYNWGNTQGDNAALWFDANDMDYCPMTWNNSYNADAIRDYVKAHPNTRYLLAYNEPNLTDQANMTPVEAAAQWANVVALAKELNLKLVSPAMNYGTLANYSDPIKWLDEFFTQPGVSIDDIYAISVHCYMSSLSALQGYIERFHKYNKPIWLTEFCAWDPEPNNVEKQIDYMVSALNYLEQAPEVERYAWFIPRGKNSVDSKPFNQLLSHTSPTELTPLGQLYTRFSSFDKSTYLPLRNGVLAHQYIATATNSITLRLTGENKPYVYGMQAGMHFDYQVSVEKDQPLQITYATITNCQLCIYIDGAAQTFVDLPKTADMNTVSTYATDYIPAAGKHTIGIELLKGSMNYYAITQ